MVSRIEAAKNQLLYYFSMIFPQARPVPIIYDTSLREGFQTPGGIGASLKERIYIAANAQRYSHWVELGMPANPVDYPIISAIKERFIQEGYPVGIAVLVRCTEGDVRKAAEVMADYKPSLVHLFVGTSDEHRKMRFGGKDEKFYEELIAESVENAASHNEFSRVIFSPEDAYRTFMQNNERLIRFIDAARTGYINGNKKVGRNSPIIFNLPDTVGYSTIYEFGELIKAVKKTFGRSVELSVHGHNDSRMAFAQAIEVYERFGVPWLQTTFGGLGERNGIASTDDAVKLLSARGYLADPRITSEDNLKGLDQTTKAIMWALGRQLPAEHLERISVSTAGIHTDLVIKDSGTYHIYGERFGSKPYVEFGATSGSKQLVDILSQHNVRFDPSDKSKLEEFVFKLKKTANETKAPITVTHILYEAYKEFEGRRDEEGISVDSYEITTSSNGKTILSMKGSIEGTAFDETIESKGPVEASMELLNKVINRQRGSGEEIVLVNYEPRVIPIIGEEFLDWPVGSQPKLPTEIGKNAHLAIKVEFRNGHGTYQGWAQHENSTDAEIGAVIDGMAKMYSLQKWQNQ